MRGSVFLYFVIVSPRSFLNRLKLLRVSSFHLAIRFIKTLPAKTLLFLSHWTTNIHHLAACGGSFQEGPTHHRRFSIFSSSLSSLDFRTHWSFHFCVSATDATLLPPPTIFERIVTNIGWNPWTSRSCKEGITHLFSQTNILHLITNYFSSVFLCQ